MKSSSPLDRGKSRIASTPSEFGGYWWRFSRYEQHGLHIRPAPRARLEKYNPWERYEAQGPKGRGGGMLRPPYLSLVELADRLRATTDWGKQRLLSHPHEPAIVRWCNEYGLLGLFFLDARQVTLYPRWEKARGSARVPTLRQFLRRPDRWTERRVAGTTNLDVVLLPEEQKPAGGLAPRQYWESDWEDPGVLLQDHDSGLYRREPLAKAMKDFFPSVPAPELETYAYPVPTSDEFWRLYAEDTNQFLRCAFDFADAVRALGGMKPSDEMTELEKQSIIRATGRLQALAAGTAPALYARKDGTFFHQWVSAALIGSFALMVLLDAARGLVNVCGNCGKVFVSSAGRARYCSARCRKTSLQREWRARKGRE